MVLFCRNLVLIILKGFKKDVTWTHINSICKSKLYADINTKTIEFLQFTYCLKAKIKWSTT